MTHQHKGKSSERFLDTPKVLSELNIRQGHTIVDAGCGNGYMAKQFLKILNSTGKIFAVDSFKTVIEKLEGEITAANMNVMEADITQSLPIEAASVDLIYLSTVFHGFSEDEIKGFQKEVIRILKPGGKLAVIEIKKQETPFGPPMDIRLSPDELIQKIDLYPISLIEAGEYFYMQMFEKK